MGKYRFVIFPLLLFFLSQLSLWAAPTKIIWSVSSFGEDDYFHRPSDIEVDHQRSLIYIADSGNNRVLVFDFDGKLLRIVGREGHGPAEFSRPTGLYIFEDGRLAVADHHNRRIQVFDKSWEFVRLISAKTVGVADLIFLDDRIYTISIYGSSGYSPDIRSEKETQPLVNVLDQEGDVIQSISVDDFPESHPFLRAIKHRVCMTLSKQRKLFLPHFAMNVIHVFDLNGNKIGEFDRPLPYKPGAPELVHQSSDKDGIIRMQATMDMVTKDAKIGPDGHLYLLTFKESYMKRSKEKDVDSPPPPPMRVDVIDTQTHKLLRSIDIDAGARSFSVLDKNRLVYVYEDNEGELFLKCIQY
ncbi:MAG: 6-bladed beta-propeller [Candidatus Aminicenantes bacterium]|nr:6-bladed beta-propeller [Candidatus Aminicenantes bacterium]